MSLEDEEATKGSSVLGSRKSRRSRRSYFFLISDMLEVRFGSQKDLDHRIGTLHEVEYHYTSSSCWAILFEYHGSPL